MSLKSVWLDHRQLKILRDNVEFCGSEELKEELDDHLNFTNDGAYLINLFSNGCFRELEQLLENCMLSPLLCCYLNNERLIGLVEEKKRNL